MQGKLKQQLEQQNSELNNNTVNQVREKRQDGSVDVQESRLRSKSQASVQNDNFDYEIRDNTMHMSSGNFSVIIGDFCCPNCSSKGNLFQLQPGLLVWLPTLL